MRASWAHPGLTVGPFQLERPLGDPGGFGAVWLATSARGRVAVKFLDPLPSNVAHAPGRFRRELEAGRLLRSPNVACPRTADLSADTPWIAYEYIEGDTLKELVYEHGPLSAWDAATIFFGIARGIRDLARAGVIHRDLALENIVVRDHPRHGLEGVVVDLGIAVMGAGSSYTRASVGRMEYQAPEQLEGVTVTPAVDVWQFGVMLVRALSGHLPYERQNTPWQMRDALTHAPNLDGVPDPFRALARACLRNDPARRPTAHALRTELDQLLRELTPLVSGTVEAVEREVRGDGDIVLTAVVSGAHDDPSAGRFRLRAEDLPFVMLGDVVTVPADVPGLRCAWTIKEVAQPANRSGNERPIVVTACPSCELPLTSGPDGQLEYRCPDPWKCPQAIKARLWRVARMLDLPLDPRAITALLSSGSLLDERGLFDLKASDLHQVPHLCVDGASALNGTGLAILRQLSGDKPILVDKALAAVNLPAPRLTLLRFAELEDFLAWAARHGVDALLPTGDPDPHRVAAYEWACVVLRAWLASGLRVSPLNPQARATLLLSNIGSGHTEEPTASGRDRHTSSSGRND